MIKKIIAINKKYVLKFIINYKYYNKYNIIVKNITNIYRKNYILETYTLCKPF